MKLTLKLVDGESFEQEVDSNDFIIGRSKKCDVVIPQDGMSRRHCRIELVDGEIFITDLGSTNGVTIDGLKIVPGVRTLYAPYLTLAFGSVQSMQIKVEENQKSPPVSQVKVSRQQSSPHHSDIHTNKTKTIKQPSAGHKPYSPRHKEKLNILMIVLAIAILAGSAWWFLKSEKSTPDDSYEIDVNSDPE